MKTPLDEKYYLLKELEKSDTSSQRVLAEQMGVSLGKINFIIKALISKGLIKMENFAHSDHKIGYRYILTPEGIKEKVQITKAFILKKEQEYEHIRQELEEARNDVNHGKN